MFFYNALEGLKTFPKAAIAVSSRFKASHSSLLPFKASCKRREVMERVLKKRNRFCAYRKRHRKCRKLAFGELRPVAQCARKVIKVCKKSNPFFVNGCPDDVEDCDKVVPCAGKRWNADYGIRYEPHKEVRHILHFG